MAAKRASQRAGQSATRSAPQRVGRPAREPAGEAAEAECSALPVASKEPSAPPAAKAPKPTPAAAVPRTHGNDAVNYLIRVKEALSAQPRKYQHFKEALLGFQNSAFDTVEVIQFVSHLLKDHPHLLQAFCQFLPEGYRIEVLPARMAAYAPCYMGTILQVATAQQLASSFVDRLADRLGPSAMLSLLDALEGSKRKTAGDTAAAALLAMAQPTRPCDPVEVYNAVAPLLGSEPLLLEELQQYVPNRAMLSDKLRYVHVHASQGQGSETGTQS